MTPTEQPKVPMKIRGGKEVLDQKALQVDGAFMSCDPHPIYEGLFFFNKRPNGNQNWKTESNFNKIGKSPAKILEKRREAREYNLTKPADEPRVFEDGQQLGLVDLFSMHLDQEITFGHIHPEYPNYCYWSTTKKGTQRWVTVEQFEEQAKKHKVWKQTPEGKAMISAHGAKRRKTLDNNIALPKEAMDALRDVYHTRDDLTLAARSVGSSEDYHVDHIYPLRPAPIDFHGSIQRPYTGLHAAWNLQILEKSENLSKSNSTPEHHEPNQ